MCAYTNTFITCICIYTNACICIWGHTCYDLGLNKLRTSAFIWHYLWDLAKNAEFLHSKLKSCRGKVTEVSLFHSAVGLQYFIKCLLLSVTVVEREQSHNRGTGNRSQTHSVAFRSKVSILSSPSCPSSMIVGLLPLLVGLEQLEEIQLAFVLRSWTKQQS